jgi:hypothetical protein
MGIESSLKNYMNQKWVKEKIKNSSNPTKQRKVIANNFKRRVSKGSIETIPGGGYKSSEETSKRVEEMHGTREQPTEFTKKLAKKFQEKGHKVTAEGLAGSKFGFFPTGKKKGGMVNSRAIAKKYFKGGLV